MLISMSNRSPVRHVLQITIIQIVGMRCGQLGTATDQRRRRVARGP
jgi:hypothetical protein